MIHLFCFSQPGVDWFSLRAKWLKWLIMSPTRPLSCNQWADCERERKFAMCHTHQAAFSWRRPGLKWMQLAKEAKGPISHYQRHSIKLELNWLWPWPVGATGTSQKCEVKQGLSRKKKRLRSFYCSPANLHVVFEKYTSHHIWLRHQTFDIGSLLNDSELVWS